MESVDFLEMCMCIYSTSREENGYSDVASILVLALVWERSVDALSWCLFQSASDNWWYQLRLSFCHPEQSRFVILSETKDLVPRHMSFFAAAQNDRGEPKMTSGSL